MIVSSSANLRITSESMLAAEITRLLGVPARKSFEKGDLVSAKSPKPSYRKWSMWLWQGEIDETRPLNERLMEVYRFLNEKEKSLPSLVDCQMDVFCGVFSDSGQIGFDIDHKVIQAFAKYPVDLVFDVYGDYTD